MSMMEDRIDKLEKGLADVKASVDELLKAFQGNGNLTVSVYNKRLRFIGSLSIPAAVVASGSTGSGIVWLIGRAFNAW